jgi:hypothetical protein
LTFDLKELNYWNKDLYVNLDALKSILNLFLHKTCLLANFICHFRNSSRYSSRNGQRSTLAECEICLWRLQFPCSLFFFFPIYIEKDMDVSFLIPLESLRFNLSNSSSTQNINGRSNILIISNLLRFESFIHKYLQNIKQKYQSVLCIKHR